MGLRDHASESKVSFVIEDSLEEEHAPLNKRCKQWSSSNGSCFSFPSQDHNILDEPSPLGLCLRKSHSLLDLIQAKLSHGDKVVSNEKDDSLNSGVKKESRAPVEKLKASNFPATLVWEVLEGELKSKIEIQWADNTALKANCPEDGPSTLSIVVARQPLFFRETNPQPRKHTLWQTATDFTGGQAIKSRKHFLQCEQGLLIKHFEKLIQCDERLQYLSQQPELKLDFPHSDFAFDNHDNLKKSDLDQVNSKGSVTPCFQNMGSPNSSLSPSFTLDNIPCEAASSSSEVINSSEADSKGPKNWDQIKLPGLRPSMSVSDFIGHIEHHLSEEIALGNLSSPAKRMDYNVMLEYIAHHLLNDNHVTTDSDEISLMSRVNSLCCLLQKDLVEVSNSHDNSHDNKSSLEGPNDEKNIQLGHDLESMQSNKTKIDMKAAESNFKLQQNLHNRRGKYRCRNSLESPKFDYDSSHQ
ncbi:hypothetical protein KIW84_071441 [Lathyrus oleraceus]|uniref:TRF2/HOY1 PH-like domain-containing protein n=1 Tax=Pisum sativum TaxID=3888 RepID=A0A9D4ZTP3_PEA|nr:hypothetical protein KIW84_071441 [Pisum sativum]